MTLFNNRDLAESAAEKLKIYAQPQRLMILSCLARAERNVTDIGEATGIVQPALSQQLATLRRADLVTTRKEAKQVWYALADEGVALCVRNMEAIFGGSGEISALAKTLLPPVARTDASGAAQFAQIL